MPPTPSSLPVWVQSVIDLYNSQANNQFLLTGNVNDHFFTSTEPTAKAVSLSEYLQQMVVPRYDVVLRYDLGNGLRVERGGPIFSQWPGIESLPRAPRAAIEFITAYLRYCANLANLGQNRIKVAVILSDADLFIHNEARQPETNAIAFLIREWSRDTSLIRHDLVSFILAENLSEVHPLVRQNSQAARIEIPLPAPREIEGWLTLNRPGHPIAMQSLGADLGGTAENFSGTTLAALDRMFRLAEHRRQPVQTAELGQFKAEIIERECPGLLEFLPPRLTLDQLQGQESLKRHLRQNLALWQARRADLIPQGYLLCGPVGTGKTFVVKCLAGEAGVPVVVLKNFRDKWYGSTEGNLEKIFRTLRALGRCCVFIDEADQSLGRRDSGGTEPGVSGRIYAMLAQEMSDPTHRGRLLWILATSRPDLVEVDLKRPGRIDVKIPLFPTVSSDESWQLIRALARGRKLELPEELPPDLAGKVPDLMTPGEVDSLLTQIQREAAATQNTAVSALTRRFRHYLRPVSLAVLWEQTRLAVAECTDADFIPERFRSVEASADTDAITAQSGGMGHSAGSA